MQPLTVSIIKSFHYLSTPLGILLVIVLLYWVSKLFSLRKISTTLLFLFFFFLWFFSTPISVHWLEKQFIASVNSEDAQDLSNLHYDAIIVAGWQEAFNKGDSNMDRFWSERLWVAAQEHKKSTKPIVIISSQYPVPNSPGPGERPYAVNKLIEWGIEEHNIINAQPGRTTYEGIKNGYQHLAKLASQNVLMVGYRNRVARKKKVLEQIFEANSNGLRNHVYVKLADSEHSHYHPDPFRLSSWLPNEKSLNYCANLTHEIAGHIAYGLFGWASQD